MTIKSISCALGMTLLLTPAAFAATAALGRGSVITLEGTSTLHPWRSESTDFSADLAVGGQAQRSLPAGLAAREPAQMTVKIPVSSLKSEHSGLDKNLRKALEADENPDIVFVLKGYALAKGQDPAGDRVTAQGLLSVAGQARPETLEASLSWKDGRAVVDGTQPLLMTDFGIKPPTMMMGTVKTGDRVVVKFHLVLEPAADATKGESN